MMNYFQNVRIVLINTSHPGNIGSVARSMKTMCLNQLYLVEPKLFPHPKAVEMASNAADILEVAHITSNLDKAIQDCTLIIGTSARDRNIPWPMLTPRECGEKTVVHSRKQNVAILFGREDSGLTNEELQRCHYHVQIPANPEYSSLNIASAVQVIAYEILNAALLSRNNNAVPIWDFDFATDQEIEGFFQHLEQLLIQIEFLNPKAPRKLMTRLRRLFSRTKLDKMEVNILRGILTEIQKKKL